MGRFAFGKFLLVFKGTAVSKYFGCLFLCFCLFWVITACFFSLVGFSLVFYFFLPSFFSCWLGEKEGLVACFVWKANPQGGAIDALVA